MRAWAVVPAILLAGCTTVGMDGFDEVAATGEVVIIEGAGPGRSGTFSLSQIDTEGTFRRYARSKGRNGDLSHDGRTSFALGQGGEFGGLSAECASSRESYSESWPTGPRSEVTTEFDTAPFVMTCGFFRDGRDIGEMELRDERSGPAEPRTLRHGFAELGDAELRLTSQHSYAGLDVGSGSALGYAMEFRDGTEGMVERSGMGGRLVLPRNGADKRAAALLSGLAIALAWDPGNID